MEMWARIDGKDYPINYGQTITDNMGEELDSMSILVSHVRKIAIKPYDDVYIHNLGPGVFVGHGYGSIHVMAEGEFYRHFLVFSYDRREVNQLDGLYNYSITLVSETKYLEKVLMPNRTVTIPFNAFGKSVFEMAGIFVERYSPTIKVSQSGRRYSLKKRFLVSKGGNVMFNAADRAELAKRNLLIVEEVFSDIQAPETSFNNPTLREALTKIFSVKNCIPVVFDGIIFARDITKWNNKITAIPGKIWDTAMMSGDQYCDRLRKNYANGLTDKNGCVFHEYVGFRNMDVSSMKFSDLKIEVKNPIYKINKFYVCYYSDHNGKKVSKIDLTSFVLPSVTRAFLSNDYMEYEANRPKTINGYTDIDGNYVLGICDYKFMTVQYGIGSTEITGFGETVRYTTNGVDYIQRTVLENIINAGITAVVGLKEFEESISVDFEDGAIIDAYHPPFKEYNMGDIVAKTPVIEGNFWSWVANVATAIFNNSYNNGAYDPETGIVSTDSLRMKSIFFEIEYQGMISSAVMVSKDLHDGDVYAIDNQQESMAIMEQDGITSKFKANRLGNETSTVTARVANFDALVDIGDYDEEHGVCYKRTISVEKDFISANYIFAKDYVLTNYFTGVFSKYRASAYASIAQSVERNENTDLQLILSHNKLLRIPQDAEKTGFSYSFDMKDIVSILSANDDLNYSMAYFHVDAPKQELYVIDAYGIGQHEDQYFSVDRAYYMSGNSMCCTFGMTDSETAGTYIRNLFPDTTHALSAVLNATHGYDADGMDAYSSYARSESAINDVTGSMQGFLSLPLSRSNGKVENITFGLIASKNGIQDSVYKANADDNTDQEIYDLYDSDLLWLPKLSNDVIDLIKDETNKFEISEKYKDAKEVISETFQIEPIAEKGIAVSPYFMKLSNIFNKYKERRLTNETRKPGSFPVFAYTDYIIENDFVSNPQYRTIHSLALYTAMNDLGMTQLQNLVDVNLTDVSFPITLYFNIGVRKPVEGSLPFIVSYVNIKKIVSVESGAINVLMSIVSEPQRYGGEITSYYPTHIYDDVKRIETGDFVARWRREDIVHKDPNATLYKMNYDDGESYGTHDMFIESTQNRRTFVYNFDSFPVDTVHVVFDDDTETEETANTSGYTLYGDVSLIRQGISGLYRYSIDEEGVYNGAYDKLISTGTMSESEVEDVSPNQYLSNGPNKIKIFSLLDDLYEVTIPRNMAWFAKPTEMPDTFDTMKTYKSLSDLTADGFEEIYLSSAESAVDGETMELTAYSDESSPMYKSMYLFYLDTDERYHFVFGTNCSTTTTTIENHGLSISAHRSHAKIYLSLVPDRSRTVYDSKMEASLKTPNYAKSEYEGVTESNLCVDKNDSDEL